MIKIILSALMLLFHATVMAENIELADFDADRFRAADHLYYKVIDSQTSTIETMLALDPTQFVRHRESPLSPALGQSTYWYRLDFHNADSKARRLILQIINPMIDQIELFTVVSGQVIQQQQLGDRYRADSPLKNSLPHFSINFAANALSQVYLRIKSDGTSVIPLLLHQPEDFQTRVYQTFLIWGAFIGIILMMMVYNGWLYISSKDRIYLFYIGYIGTMLIQLGTFYGYGFHLLPFTIQTLLSYKIVALNYVISIFVILFTLYLLRYNQDKSATYKNTLKLCAVIALCGSSALLLPEYSAVKIYYVVQLLTYAVIITLTVAKIMSGNRWAKYYLLSWLPLFIGTIVAQLLLLDFIPFNDLSHNTLLFSILIEIALISFALAARFRANETQRFYHATHDTVTDLPNLVFLTKNIGEQMAQQQHFSLMLFKADRFQEIRPALGLMAANDLITILVNNVSNYFSNMSDLLVFEQKNQADIHLSRINDDTFALVLLGDHTQEDLNFIILAIQETVATPINVGDCNISTSCTVGLVFYPQFGCNADIMVQQALHALELAKTQTSKFSFYHGEQKVRVHRQLQLVAELQQAIDEDSLEIYHQPQIHLATQTIYGNEALLRWHHKTLGFISPEVFVALAEDTGLIGQLTEWVITRSLKQHAQLTAAGFCQNISINLSAKDLTQPGLIAHIMTTIADLSIDPANIVFELTESATADDPVHARKTIDQLHELNVKVAIDDFGTGYSSLEYLSKLPFHELKVDKSFVLDLLESGRNQAITKTTIEMAKNLDIFVVAEGVETPAIETLLRSYHCEIGQGYLYAKPLALDDYLAWLGGDNQYVRTQPLAAVS